MGHSTALQEVLVNGQLDNAPALLGAAAKGNA